MILTASKERKKIKYTANQSPELLHDLVLINSYNNFMIYSLTDIHKTLTKPDSMNLDIFLVAIANTLPQVAA